MSGETYGYVRVSTRGQKEDRQLIAMREFGVPAEHIVVEKQSGRDFARPLYRRLVGTLGPGDVLVVKSIDRLGRNYAEILEQWAVLTKDRGIAIVVLDMPLLDTRESRDLTGVLVADIVLQLLSYVAQTERIAAARERGVRFGRTPIALPPDRFAELEEAWRFGRVTAAQAGRELGVSRSTFQRRARAWREQGA